MSEQRTRFDYLLNALEFAAQAEDPAKADYGGARRRLFEYVREMERKAAAYDAQPPSPLPSEGEMRKEMEE